MAFRRDWAGGVLTAHWDAHMAQWRAEPAPTRSRRSFTQLALVPTLRLRPDGGLATWFLEGGIGLSLLDSDYRTTEKRFGSRFNFSDHVGVGWSWGPQRRHEAAFILRHVSNAGIRRPNPGEDFLQVRYSLAY